MTEMIPTMGHVLCKEIHKFRVVLEQVYFKLAWRFQAA